MALHQPDRVYQWLVRDDTVDECEFRRRTESGFRLDAETAETPLDVFRDGEDEPLRIVGQVDVDPELLMVFGRDSPRQTFFTQLTAIVTGTDGSVEFLDDDGNPCELREMRRVVFETRIYPDELSRNALLSAVQDVSNAVGYLDVVLHDFDPPTQ